MKSFLSEVAEQLYAKYGDEVSSLTLLFPSQRARLFFSEALADIVERPIWAPRFMTVDELMGKISPLRAADRLRLVCELHGVYNEFHTEDFDHFYNWGQMLVADFDMVDKYMVDAEQLFANIADIKEIEADLSYLTPEQEEYVRRFWNTLSDSMTLSEQKSYFLKIWRNLPQIYARYKSRLHELGIGYSGMIYRDAAQILKQATTSPLESGRYVVVGFNALSSCEKVLFDHLKSAFDADFFWDYSDYFFDDTMQEAGRFIRENVARYPSQYNISHGDLRRNISHITVASTTTSAAQCKYVAQLLEQIAGRDKSGKLQQLDRNTAIVLTDENMLEPLLYALPSELKAGGVNVTMGYPLRSTLAYSFVERLLELQNHCRERNGEITFYYVDVEGLLTHPYLADRAPKQIADIRKRIVKDRIYNLTFEQLSELPFASSLFVAADGSQSLFGYLDSMLWFVLADMEPTETLQIEYIIQARKALRQAANMVDSCGIELTLSLTRSLIRRHLQGVRIPFEGEPLKGLQVMGILETRNIDFKNVIILSMNDSNFPGTRIADSSAIPYSLRFAYNLPTQEHHQGVYAYYFYRLISRAENLWMCYCSTADEKGAGEPSRYIRQLEYESGMKISKVKVGVEVNIAHQQQIVIPKDSRTLELLKRYTDGEVELSPTAFSTYVQCPLRFFYRYLAQIRVDDSLEEGLDDKTFGNIFHLSAEYLYTAAVGEAEPLVVLNRITAQDITSAVDRAISELCFGGKSINGEQLQGELAIVRRIVVKYLHDNLIAYDKNHPDFTILSLEDSEGLAVPFEFEVAGEKRSVIFGGRADRIDSLNGGAIRRIIDYKTGGEHLTFAGFDKLFHGKDAQRVGNTINTLLYAMIAQRKFGCDTQPALYYLREMYRDDYSPLLRMGQGAHKRAVTIERYSEVAEEFETQVRETLCSLFNPAEPFTQVEDVMACKYCDYNPICSRKRGN